MNPSEPTITITVSQYEDLIDSERMLIALQNAGVDNWEWYDVAMEDYHNNENE